MFRFGSEAVSHPQLIVFNTNVGGCVCVSRAETQCMTCIFSHHGFLFADYVDDRLYWIDAKTHQIGSSDLDGLNRRMVLRGHQYLGHPFAITVFEVCITVDMQPTQLHLPNNPFIM